MRASGRKVLAVLTATVVGVLAVCVARALVEKPSGEPAFGTVPVSPSEPVALTVVDAAGNLRLTRRMIDEFVATNPDIISKVSYSTAPSPDLVSTIRSRQGVGPQDVGLVLTGAEGLVAGCKQGLWEQILPTYADRLGNMKDYLDPAATMQKLASAYGVTVTYSMSGPLLAYLPGKVPVPPTTAEELLVYAEANPGTVEYARPANSGPSRAFIMGLPYILGDADPLDPVNGWDRTWDYLAELGRHVTTYPTSTTRTMKDLASGTAAIVPSTIGWDLNARALGILPGEAEVATLENVHWVGDARYAVIPRGASPDVQSAALRVVQFMLTREQQAKAYGSGYLYPGPAVRGIDLSMAPTDIKEKLAKFARPEYDQLIETGPTRAPLSSRALRSMLDRWDRDIGGSKVTT
jgi:putative spermidine/putrescine transport system substrate-binding protein